jgi:hypothetical protein
MSASATAARKLRGIALKVARACLANGRIEGNDYVAGNIYGASGDSLRVCIRGDNVGLWIDNADIEHRGDLLDLIRFCLTDGDRSRALAEARKMLGDRLDAPEPVRSAAAVEPRPGAKETKALARRLWYRSVPIHGTLAEHYLKGRGIDPAVATALRYLPSVLHTPTRRWYPAVIAAVVGPDRRFAGIHRIYLEPDGRQLDHRYPKRALGSLRGGWIRLAPPRDGDTVRDVTEGVEDGLALLTAAPALWVDAVLSSSHLHALKRDPASSVEFVHHDRDRAGEAGGRAFRAANGDDPDIILLPPPPPVTDLNGLLQQGGREAVLRHLDLLPAERVR